MVVIESRNLGRLTIAGGATIKAPDSYLVAMTLDGVQTPIKASDYKGKIVLAVTSDT